MAYLLSRLIIFTIWITKWVLIRSRSFIPALFVVIILIFFKDWYINNEMFGNVIFIVLTAGVIISWIFTLINKLKYLKRQRKRDVAYAYRIAGEPIIATKKTQ